jgi:chromosome segregation ATPase
MTVSECETKLRQLREALNDLIVRRNNIDGATLKLQSERDSLAYAALTGDDKAQRHITSIRTQLAKLRDTEIELAAAISTAHTYVSSAEVELRQAQQASNAVAAQKLLPALLEHGVAGDAAIVELREALAGIRDTIRDLRTLGHHAVNERVMQLAIKTALEVALIDEGLAVPLHQPSLRRSLTQLAGSWVANVESQQLAHTLQNPTTEAA